MKKYKYCDADIADDILNNLDEARELIEQAETDKLIGDNYAKMLYEDFNNMKDRKELPIKAKILIVDDDEAIRGVLKAMVSKLGHDTEVAENGISALEQMEAAPPDLVLLDINMPEMDGNMVMDCMRANEKLCLIPVIIITAVDDESNAIKNIEKGVVDYLPKPFNLKLLTARIKSCLEKKQLVEWKRDVQL